jgi:integrase
MRRGIIASNPADAIKPLSKDSKTRGILAVDEVKTLFGPNVVVEYWTTSTYSLANRTAATTGMRMGEIHALRWCDIGKDRITVHHSWDRRFGLKTTKTAKERAMFQEVVHRSRVGDNGVTTHPSCQPRRADEHPQECPMDAVGSSPVDASGP